MNELHARLREHGVTCRVETRERLAILIPAAEFSPGVEDRQLLLKLARDEGLTHVALELDPDGAALLRD
jgi:hypothetical protein